MKKIDRHILKDMDLLSREEQRNILAGSDSGCCVICYFDQGFALPPFIVSIGGDSGFPTCTANPYDFCDHWAQREGYGDVVYATRTTSSCV